MKQQTNKQRLKEAIEAAKQAAFFAVLKQNGLPIPTPEYKFCPDRRFRADYAWPEQKIILEVEGGVWTNGRHTRGSGFLGDMEKYNLAAVLGYRVFRTVPTKLTSKETIQLLKDVLI